MITDSVPTPAEAPRARPVRGAWLPRIKLPGLGLRASERSLLLHIVDFGLLSMALILAVKLHTPWLDADNAVLYNWRWFITLGVLWWIIAQLAEVYDLARAASASNSIITTAAAAGVTVLLYQMIPVVTPPLASRGLGFFFTVVAVASVAVWRGVYARLLVQPAFERRLLVVGAGAAGRALGEVLARVSHTTGTPNPFHGTGASIVGYVDDAALSEERQTVAGVPVLGRSVDLLRLARELVVDEVVLAITDRSRISGEAFDALLACREQGFHVTTMSSVYEHLLGRVPVEHVGRNLNAVLPVEDRGPMERLFKLAKRGMDIGLGVLGLIPLGLTIPLVAFANVLASPGPLFYKQVRVGKGGRLFEVIKYRTMHPNAEAKTGAVWASGNDPRVTPVGRFLRKSRIDELPQFLNVLRGEMSAVGPRPERPEFVADLAKVIPFYRARHAVKPGITGWAQVRFGYGNTVEAARIKLEFDLYYVRHAGFYLDALILLKTAAVMLKLQGK